MPIRRVFFYFGLAVLVVAVGLGFKTYLDRDKSARNKASTPIAVVTVKPATKTQNSTPQIGGSFSLINQNAQPVTDADFKGRHMLVFFGYTYCPDVCPMTMTNLSGAMDLLGEDAKLVQPLFITVDPLRDTPDQIKAYLEHFHKSFVGLTGTLEQVEVAKKAYRIFSQKADQHPNDAEDYIMNHSSITYLMGPDGKFEAFFSNNTESGDIVQKILEFL